MELSDKTYNILDKIIFTFSILLSVFVVLYISIIYLPLIGVNVALPPIFERFMASAFIYALFWQQIISSIEERCIVQLGIVLLLIVLVFLLPYYALAPYVAMLCVLKITNTDRLIFDLVK